MLRTAALSLPWLAGNAKVSMYPAVDPMLRNQVEYFGRQTVRSIHTSYTSWLLPS